MSALVLIMILRNFNSVNVFDWRRKPLGALQVLSG